MKFDHAPHRRRRTAHNRRARRGRRRDRRDASSDWRTEYRAQEAPLPDGGSRYALPDRGARVRDRDDDTEDPDELLVAAVHRDTPAREYYLETLGCTVADANPGYDPAAPVIDAVYAADAEAYLRETDGTVPIAHAVDGGAVTAYSFPADRLVLRDDGGERA